MITRPFFSLGKPNLRYPLVKSHKKETIKEIPLPDRITLFLERSQKSLDDLIFKAGDRVKTGQKVKLVEGSDDYLISTATGTIMDISEYTGYLGQIYASVSIKTDGEDQWDDEFNEMSKTALPESPVVFLNSLPGDPDFASLFHIKTSLDTIIINGMDKDLMVTTNQLIIKTETEYLTKGIEHLKRMTRVGRIIVTVPPHLSQEAEKTGAEVEVINPVYPEALPEILMKNILGKIVPAGRSCEEEGVGFVNAETVAALGRAFSKGEIPVNKLLTIIDKDYTSINVRTRIGTHVKEILDALHIETRNGDRLVLGGPMTGYAIYSEDIPVRPDTDAIMVQDGDQIILSSDHQCVNCGECVRACPANIPVNMLVRLLAAGHYEDAVDQYDLLCCIECGLCSYVCTARIPVFQYIMLGKYEFEKIKSAEEINA